MLHLKLVRFSLQGLYQILHSFRGIVLNALFRSVEGFLWSLRAAQIPLRIETCTLNSRDENKDELSMTLMLTTILDSTAENTAGGGR